MSDNSAYGQAIITVSECNSRRGARRRQAAVSFTERAASKLPCTDKHSRHDSLRMAAKRQHTAIIARRRHRDDSTPAS